MTYFWNDEWTSVVKRRFIKATASLGDVTEGVREVGIEASQVDARRRDATVPSNTLVSVFGFFSDKRTGRSAEATPSSAALQRAE